jgi:membrane protein YdbS with pleckstrin-like domain
MDAREFKPIRMPFMIPRIVGALVLTALLSLGIVLPAVLVPAWPLLIALPFLWLVILVPTLFGAHVAYKKERYEIHADHLVAHRGGLLSDGRTELDIRNVTHVRLRLPWLRHRFFKIGDVRVESAGSAASEITFQCILHPEKAFEEVQDLMRSNGFSLARGEALHEESPTLIGALTDVVQTLFVVLFTLVWLIGPIFIGVVGAAEAVGGLGAVVISILGVGVALGSAVLTLFGLAVRYLDLTRRTYTVYEDTVEYTEGFLTRDNAFIPYENIADASTKRTAIDQILGLYDVAVSCQGSASEIKFRRLARGQELREAIGTVVATAAAVKREADAQDEAKAEASESAEGTEGTPKKATRKVHRLLVDPQEAWTADLKMNMMRAQAPLLLTLPMPPIWLLAAIGVAIQASRTTYHVGQNSLGSDFSFIGARQQEFAYDKVTGVQISRSPFDKLFKTVSVQIWSIGSPQPLTIAHVLEESLDLPALLRQCGIPSSDEAQGELRQRFSAKVWLIQNVFSLAFLVLLTLGALPVALLIHPILLLFVPLMLVLPLPAAVATAYRTKQQRITFHAEHMEAQTGIFFRQHIYVRYDNIKKVETVAIPLTDQGRLKVYVAGERVMQQQQGQQNAGMKVPYSLQGVYIEDISAKVDALDALLLGLIEPSQIDGEHPQGADVVTTAKPAVANSVVPMVILGIFIWPLLPFVPIVAWQLKVRRYEVETDRVVMRGGILFKSVVSVLFNRIDSIQQNQGALGKAFGNGQVTILTAGSSAPDFTVANVPDYTGIYDTIRANYGKA